MIRRLALFFLFLAFAVVAASPALAQPFGFAHAVFDRPLESDRFECGIVDKDTLWAEVTRYHQSAREHKRDKYQFQYRIYPGGVWLTGASHLAGSVMRFEDTFADESFVTDGREIVISCRGRQSHNGRAVPVDSVSRFGKAVYSEDLNEAQGRHLYALEQAVWGVGAEIKLLNERLSHINTTLQSIKETLASEPE